jgi:hypothetical protein
MPSKSSRASIGLLPVALIAAATVSIVPQSAVAAHARHLHQTYLHHRGTWLARGATLPYGPEYGFLRQLPPNAVRGPGYTFVPGVGILGESCDLPTSACTNEYRDVQ